jgi:hypothetical protein
VDDVGVAPAVARIVVFSVVGLFAEGAVVMAVISGSEKLLLPGRALGRFVPIAP